MVMLWQKRNQGVFKGSHLSCRTRWQFHMQSFFMFALELYEEFHKTFAPKVRQLKLH